MRTTAEFYVSALVRRANDDGAFAVVARRGATEAGAIYIAVDDRSEAQTLYGPAIAGFDRATDASRDDRRFALIGRFDTLALRERMAREASFDPDFWLVEIDDRNGRHFLDDALVEEN